MTTTKTPSIKLRKKDDDKMDDKNDYGNEKDRTPTTKIRRPQRKQKRRNNGKHYSHMVTVTQRRKISCLDDDADGDNKVENDKCLIFWLRQYIKEHLQ
jgi:hypothetical protein